MQQNDIRRTMAPKRKGRGKGRDQPSDRRSPPSHEVVQQRNYSSGASGHDRGRSQPSEKYFSASSAVQQQRYSSVTSSHSSTFQNGESSHKLKYSEAGESHVKTTNEPERQTAHALASSSDHRFKFQGFPPSPGPGTVGSKINLIVNNFKLSCKLTEVYHYHVDIVPEVKGGGGRSKNSRVSKEASQKIFALFIEEMRKTREMSRFDPIYDGKENIYTASPLPIKERGISLPISVEIDGKLKKFRFTITPVEKQDGSNVISLQPLENIDEHSLDSFNEVLLALNAIMNHRDINSNELRLGQCFFLLSQAERVDIGEGLEIWRGYRQSVHITQKGPVVIVDLAHKIFHKNIPVIDYASEVLNFDLRNEHKDLNSFEIGKIKMALKGVKVRATHLGYKYQVESISSETAEQLEMEMQGRYMTVAQYFQEKYGRFSLKYAHLPCLKMKKPGRNTYIPFEVCEILEGQPKAKSEDDDQRFAATMIKHCSVPPKERFKKIEERVAMIGNEQMRTFKLFMDLRPVTVEGRVLPPPQLMYDGYSFVPQEGAWKIKGKFMRPRGIESWTIIRFHDQDRPQFFLKYLKPFQNKFEQFCYSFGLRLREFRGIHMFGRDDSAEQSLRKNEVINSSLVIIVLSKRDRSHNYNEIKFIADYRLQLVTQCVLEDRLVNLRDDYLTNICLKVNAKLGGANHRIVNAHKIFAAPVIIIGADVVHSIKHPSIAAVVGSLDSYPSKYKVSCRIQENKKMGKLSQEVILDLKNMVKVILKAFDEHTQGKRPEKIVFFRDGVCESQFKTVGVHEVSAVQKASLDVYNCVIPLTFLIVQKRHHVKAKPENPSDGAGKAGNMPPGTTIDKDITYPNTFDYFQASHKSDRGTTKIPRYTVLHDDNEFTADEMEELSHHMCYMYAKCTKSISIPAPVKYADLAAYRAKNYVDFLISEHKKRKGRQSTYSGLSYDLQEFAQNSINEMEKSKNYMFYI